MTITVNYANEMTFNHMARTVNPCDLGCNEKSGWTIEGEVCEDYYEWVNEFKATHPEYGTIEGDFEVEVTADSQEGLDHFLEHHPVDVWDYWDI